MTQRPTTRKPTFNAKTRQLYASLKRRGSVSFSLEEFREWMRGRAYRGAPLWCCEYSREFIGFDVISIDHKLPLSMGGTGTLDNLAVCTEKENRIKGSLPYDQYLELKRVVELWPLQAQQDLWRRLAARPAWGRKKR